MAFYPSYKLADVLAIHSKTFFVLLTEGYRRQAREAKMAAIISMLPYLEKNERASVLNELDRASADPSDILIDKDDYSGMTQLKQIFGQKPDAGSNSNG